MVFGMIIYLHAYFMITLQGYIGYAPDIYELISDHEIQNTDDDQLYFTKLYLDEDLRVSLSVQIILLSLLMNLCILIGWYIVEMMHKIFWIRSYEIYYQDHA